MGTNYALSQPLAPGVTGTYPLPASQSFTQPLSLSHHPCGLGGFLVLQPELCPVPAEDKLRVSLQAAVDMGLFRHGVLADVIPRKE